MTYSNAKLICCDLDGTLLNSKGEISSTSKNTLRMIRSKGILVAICSGRPLSSILQHVDADLFDYASCLNGQDLFCCKNGLHYEKDKLITEDLQYLCSLLDTHMVMMNYHDQTRSITAASRKYILFADIFSRLQNLRWISKQMPVHKRAITSDPMASLPSSAAKVCFCSTYGILKKIAKELPSDRCTSFFVSKQWLEVQRLGISKGESIRKIMELENIAAEQCISFGDGENDISMLKICGTGIAMANAMPKTKKAADAVTLSHDHDGVAVWLQNNLLAADHSIT